MVRYSNTKLGKKVIDNSGDNEHNAYNVHDNVKQNGRPMLSFCCTNTLLNPVKAIAIVRGPSKERMERMEQLMIMAEFEVQFVLDQTNGNEKLTLRLCFILNLIFRSLMHHFKDVHCT